MATTVLTRGNILVNATATATIREPWEGEKVTRKTMTELADLARKYETLEPMGISPFSPLGEFAMAVLDTPLAGAPLQGEEELGTDLGQEYSDHLDAMDDIHYDLPEDYCH